MPPGLRVPFGLPGPVVSGPGVPVELTEFVPALPRGEVCWRFLSEASRDPQGLQALVLKNTGRHPSAHDHESPDAHQALLPGHRGTTLPSQRETASGNATMRRSRSRFSAAISSTTSSAVGMPV